METKKQFMVEIILPPQLTDEFIRLIPKQRMQVNKLFLDGSLVSYSLASDRSRLWAVFSMTDEDDLLETLTTFPLYPFMRFSIRELLFNQSVGTVLPHVSLN